MRVGIVALAVALLAPTAAPAEVVIEWAFVGSPGNAPDTAENCFAADCGAVPYPYAIGKYEVTNGQWVEFLNAKAATDPYSLFSPSMESEATGGITRSGDPGSYSYAAKPGFANKPVTYVTFYDALRFANWLQNGQGAGDTETGAYTITSQGIADNTIARNPGAQVFVPSENEWYKAAYYDGQAGVYYDYPAGSDSEIVCATPTAAANRANCDQTVDGPTDVGSYPGSASPFGTFDQGGNVFEWNEQIDGPARGLRGDGWGSPAFFLAASNPGLLVPSNEFGIRVGFRVASTAVPEPDAAGGLAAAGACLALARRRRTKRRRIPAHG